ncbi:MAG: cation-translocating P-type ATPase [Pirellulaceae bacterium]|nr:cation-translocating P-type ATPase [Pirellulaceae bacterium]
MLPLDHLLEQLQARPDEGLSTDDARQRLVRHGPNELTQRGLKSIWRILWEQVSATLIVVLIVAAAISAVLGDTKEAAAILVIVVLNAALGLQQEYRAERAMAALRRLAVPRVKVRRDGRLVELSARELVPGDLVLLESGSAVPADGRVVDASNLRVLEATLTGESEPVDKRADFQPAPGTEVPLGDRQNMVFLGTSVTYGRGAVVVCDTGMQTELGRIAGMIQDVRSEPTPLQRRLDRLGKSLALIALLIVAVVFGLGLLLGEDLKEMFLTAVSMAVAAVPEGLPAVVTIALALGAQRMLRRRALIRQLPAVETLGSVTVICSDKTGTLTLNKMTVTVLNVAGRKLEISEPLVSGRPQLDAGGELVADRELVRAIESDHSLRMLLAGGALCNDATLQTGTLQTDAGRQRIRTVGDPTEAALVVAAARLGLDKRQLERELPRVAELPFDSDRKRMTTVHDCPPEHWLAQLLARGLESGLARGSESALEPPSAGLPVQPGRVAFTKGAVDGLLQLSSHVWTDDHAQPLDDGWRQRIRQAHDELAGRGVRVLGVAIRPPASLAAETEPSGWERELIFVGLAGMIDPPRPEAAEAVVVCRQAGIRPIMITGDHPLTAQHIARQLRIVEPDQPVVTGVELERMTDEQLDAAAGRVSVFARVSPAHKLRLVRRLQHQGQVVAMTGDGVNDAPALKQADIGVAMGITGTDVAKEASDAVLQDDNFATIVAAVQEGRIIYDNIRKFIRYTMTSNTGEMLVMLLAPLLAMKLPLLPLQILWVNLVTDGLPGLALGLEPGERDTMRRPPHPPGEHPLARGMAVDILWIGTAMGLVSLLAAWLYWPRGTGEPTETQLQYWRTIVFTVLTLSQMGNALAIRSSRDSLWRIGLLSNKYLLGAVLLTLGLQLAIIYTPLNVVFDTQPLRGWDLLFCLALSTVVFWLVEAQKLLLRWRRPRAADRVAAGMDQSGSKVSR